MGVHITAVYGFLTGMDESGWKKRLHEALANDGRSYREISRAAGLSYNYVSQVFTDRKSPSIDNFIAICRTLGVSPIHIITGAEVTPETEALLEAWAQVPSYRRKALLSLISERPGA